MKNKSMTGFQWWNILLIFGATVVALLLASPSQMQQVFSSSEVPSTALVPPDFKGKQEAIDHINQAQSALQQGDTAGAQTHLDSAKKALGCNPGDPHC